MPPPAPQPAYVHAIKVLLRPLVRGLIAHGVTLPGMTALLKHIYVEAAEDFRMSTKRLTDSRVSLLTGVHRKDVKRIRDQERATFALSNAANIGAQVVALWTGDARYLDDTGAPAALPRMGAGSFEELVERINRDMRPRTLLDEWLRRKLVSVDDTCHLHLNAEAFVPSQDYDDLAFYFGRNLHDHIAVSVHNLEGGERPLLERSTYFDGLSEASVNELEALARQIGMDALVKLNKEAQKCARRDSHNIDADKRFNFGLYFYRDDLALPAMATDASDHDEKDQNA